MSQQNVDAVRRSVEAANRGEPEPWSEIADDSVLFEPLRASIEGGYRGLQGMQDFWADTRENFDVFEVRYSDVRDLGDRVLTLGVIRVRGTGSGAETTVATAAIWTFSGERLVHYKDFGDKRAAIAEAGLDA